MSNHAENVLSLNMHFATHPSVWSYFLQKFSSIPKTFCSFLFKRDIDLDKLLKPWTGVSEEIRPENLQKINNRVHNLVDLSLLRLSEKFSSL